MATRTFERVGDKYIGRYVKGSDQDLDEICDTVGLITKWVYRIVRHKKKIQLPNKKRKKTIEWYEINEVYYLDEYPAVVGLSVQSEDSPENLAIDWEMRNDAFRAPILTFDDDDGRFIGVATTRCMI